MNFSSPTRRRRERGYMLLTLMLFVTLLAIGSLAWIQKVDFQVKRDREEELIHRGVQYSRAIRRYVKKFGRYPSKIEDLESTNNIRFLRKRYKDPITGKPFKLLRMNDVQMSFSPGAASGLAPGSPGGPSMMQGGAPGALNPNTVAMVSPGGAGPSAIPNNSPGNNGQQSGTQDNSNTQENSNKDTDSSSSKSDNDSSQPNQSGFNGPTFGGLPIVGVASTSKERTIRVFNKKDRYYQWQFIYDPSTDRGGLLTTPNQPAIQGAMSVNQMQNGQQNNNGQSQGFGFSPGGINNQPQQPAQQTNQQQQ